ncbi:MAG: cAMP-activated global transcriptional regulator CRP [Methylovulum sp.]|nr:cAMP-activated global transcriptional regulator CRP [Methylovulum sp.]
MTLDNPLQLYRPEALTAFLKLCHKKHYPSKAVIMKPGDSGDRLYYIIEGSVSVCAEDVDSKQELMLAYVNKNEFLGEVGIFKDPEERKVMVKTRCSSYLAEVGYAHFRHLLRHDLLEYAPDLLYMIGEQLSERLLTTSRKFTDLAFMDVEGRIARALLDLCQQPDAMTHPDGVQLHISRQEIGRLVGCSREMAGRILRELENKKLLTAHGKTIVVYGSR